MTIKVYRHVDPRSMIVSIGDFGNVAIVPNSSVMRISRSRKIALSRCWFYHDRRDTERDFALVFDVLIAFTEGN